MMLGNLFPALVNLVRQALFDPRCVLCDKPLVTSAERAVCHDCRAGLTLMPEPYCRHCGKKIQEGQECCGDCLLAAPLYQSHRSFGIYEGPLQQLILKYKYGKKKHCAGLIAELLAETCQQRISGEFAWVIPVPSDPSHHDDFEPIREVARIFSKITGIPLSDRYLRKNRKTPQQAGLSMSQRLVNLHGAFGLRHGHLYAGKRLLLMDDVYTTGSTIKEATRVLTAAGGEVTALTLARSV